MLIILQRTLNHFDHTYSLLVATYIGHDIKSTKPQTKALEMPMTTVAHTNGGTDHQGRPQRLTMKLTGNGSFSLRSEEPQSQDMAVCTTEIEGMLKDMGPSVVEYAKQCEVNGLPVVKLYELAKDGPKPLRSATAATVTAQFHWVDGPKVRKA